MFIDPGTPINLQFEVRDEDDVLTDAATTEFWWRIGRGGAMHKDTVPTSGGTGLYNVTFTPDQGGTVYYRFATTLPKVVVQNYLYVEPDYWDQGIMDYQG
jgi:hypothetical protein